MIFFFSLSLHYLQDFETWVNYLFLYFFQKNSFYYTNTKLCDFFGIVFSSSYFPWGIQTHLHLHSKKSSKLSLPLCFQFYLSIRFSIHLYISVWLPINLSPLLTVYESISSVLGISNTVQHLEQGSPWGGQGHDSMSGLQEVSRSQQLFLRPWGSTSREDWE